MRVLFSRIQDWTWEVVMIDGVGPVLGFKAETPMFVVGFAIGSRKVGNEVAGIKLHAHIVRIHVHYATTFCMAHADEVLHIG